MRVSRSTILLIKLKTDQDISVIANDRQNVGIDTIMEKDNDMLNLSIPVCLPEFITLRFSGRVELVSISLAGLKFNQKNLSDVAKYHARGRVEDNVWDSAGWVELNLFDNDPFLYHLNIGTNILI